MEAEGHGSAPGNGREPGGRALGPRRPGRPRERLLAALLLAVATGTAACGGEEGAPRAEAGSERAARSRKGTPGRAAAGYDAGTAGKRAPASEAHASVDTALRRLAEEAVPRVEAASGLEFVRPPRLARSSRAKLARYVERQLDEQLPPARARGTARAYARLGLLPDTVELRSLMKSLYLSQVVGYYAPDADTLFVREGVEGASLEPVLVHELVHALQDQHMDLDSLLAARRASNDAASAGQAALEGHATYVMLEDVLARRTGQDVDLGAFDLAGLLRGVDLSSLGGAPELAGAPRVIRETLLFPYTGGLTFMQAYWDAADGRPAPLGAEMPTSTEQILHPGRFTGEERDRPTRLRFPAGPGGAWRVVHADGLGEFEVRLFLEEFLADSARARRAAAGWDGDRYRLVEAPGGDEVLVWATVWDFEEDASEFADAVGAALRSRYGGSRGAAPGRTLRVRRLEIAGRPAVLATDAPADLDARLPDWLTRVELESPSRP